MYIIKGNNKLFFYFLCFSILLTTLAIEDESPSKNSPKLKENINDNTGKVLFKTDIGAADFWLKKYIIKEIPALSNSSISDWEKVNLLRDWVAKNVVVARGIAPLEVEYGYSIYNENAAQLLAIQLSGEGGFYCGGISVTTKKIFNLFGYPAIVYNMVFRFEDGKFASHVITLVKINHNGKDMITVQDCFYNYTITYLNNNDPVNIFDMLDSLAKKRVDNLKMRFSSGNGKLYLSQKNGKLEKSFVSWENIFHNAFGGGMGKGVKVKTGETNFLYYFLSPEGVPGEGPFREVYLKAQEAYKRAFGTKLNQK